MKNDIIRHFYFVKYIRQLFLLDGKTKVGLLHLKLSKLIFLLFLAERGLAESQTSVQNPLEHA